MTISESRTYVAMCKGVDSSYYFVKFELPENWINNHTQAITFYMRFGRVSNMVEVFPFEEFHILIDQTKKVRTDKSLLLKTGDILNLDVFSDFVLHVQIMDFNDNIISTSDTDKDVDYILEYSGRV